MSSTSNKYCRKTKVAIVRDIIIGTEIRKLETDEQETEKLASTTKYTAGEISFYFLNFSLCSVSSQIISRHCIGSLEIND
jgi:hypothetical protein